MTTTANPPNERRGLYGREYVELASPRSLFHFNDGDRAAFTGDKIGDPAGVYVGVLGGVWFTDLADEGVVGGCGDGGMAMMSICVEPASVSSPALLTS